MSGRADPLGLAVTPAKESTTDEAPKVSLLGVVPPKSKKKPQRKIYYTSIYHERAKKILLRVLEDQDCIEKLKIKFTLYKKKEFLNNQFNQILMASLMRKKYLYDKAKREREFLSLFY